MVNKVAIGVVIAVVLVLGGLVGSQVIHQGNDNQKIEKQTKNTKSSQAVKSSATTSSAAESSASSATSSSETNDHIVIHNADEAVAQLKKTLNDDQLNYANLAYEEDMYLVSAHYSQQTDIENKTGEYIVYENGDVKPEKQVPQDAVKFDKYMQVNPNSPVTPKEKVIVVHNAQEAVGLQRELMQNNGEDVNGDFTYAGSQNPNGTYQVIVKSTSLQQGGGSGTIGVYIIDPDGSSELRK